MPYKLSYYKEVKNDIIEAKNGIIMHGQDLKGDLLMISKMH
jgi:hypothetical protein